MTSNPESIVQQVQDEVQDLLTYVTGPGARSEMAYTVALTDGAEALQQQLMTHFPAYTLILDIIHATE
jgi:hypothetical protein